jgi:pyridoxal phosphate enzyme (YggS family)
MSTSVASRRITENLRDVRQRMDRAARSVGRRGEDVTLVAVTKYVDPAAAAALVEAGCRDLAESRPQELWRKAASLPAVGIRWHLVGHLQRNKVRRTLPLISLLHSGDSWRLLAEVDQQAMSLGLMVPVLLEVNVSGDATKHGFRTTDVRETLASAATLDHLQIRGLMAMASREGDLDTARRDFRTLRELRDTLRSDLPQSVSLDELSMGMSGDFEVAIQEGATIVRVGSALFEGVAA